MVRASGGFDLNSPSGPREPALQENFGRHIEEPCLVLMQLLIIPMQALLDFMQAAFSRCWNKHNCELL